MIVKKMVIECIEVAIVLLLSITASLPAVEGVHCFVCSWSPNENQSDICRNLDESRVRTHDCIAGCEAVTILDRNEDLEMFYRNCIKSGSPVTNGCYRKTSKSFSERVCTCDYDRCNASAPKSTFASPFLLVTLSTIAVVLTLIVT